MAFFTGAFYKTPLQDQPEHVGFTEHQVSQQPIFNLLHIAAAHADHVAIVHHNVIATDLFFDQPDMIEIDDG